MRVLFFVTCILVLNLVTTMNIRLQKRYTEKDICDETKETAHAVKVCPVDIATFNKRSNEKNCEGKCMGQELVYHCVMFNNSFVEVCAPRTYITGQCCALYNKQLGRVIEDIRRPCPKCPEQYLSDDYETASLCVDHYCGEEGNRHKRDCMGGVPVKAPESSTQVVTKSTHELHNKEPNNDDQWNSVMFIIIVICVFVLLLAMAIAYFQRKRLKRLCKVLEGGVENDNHNKTSLQITTTTHSENTEECKMLSVTI